MLITLNKAVRDMIDNRFLNLVTIITISLSVLIVSAFALFFVNANDVMSSWKKGIKVMAYLNTGIPDEKIIKIKHKIQGMYGVYEAVYISKKEAFTILKNRMKRQASLLEDLKNNPLPDAFEIRMIASSQSLEKIEDLAIALEALPFIADVEYGQAWIGRFVDIFNLFRLTGYTMSGLFVMASLFITANTIRLILYSRRIEIEIMHLVGAEESFIKAPFYIQSIIQGSFSGIFGLGLLFVAYVFISSSFEQGFSPGLLTIRFLSLEMSGGIILCSMFVGWFGCYLSLKQFLK